MSTFGATNPGPGESTSSSITILLVQGSFQIPEVYGKLVDSLEAQGFPTIHPRLPSCSNVDDLDFPKRSLIDDALVIRSELVRLVEYMNKTVVVVMHSYGGLVGSEAVPEELSYSKRRAQGLTGGVIHLFFFTAFMLNEGQSVLSAFGESPNNDVKPDGRFTIRNGAQTLYNDLSPSEAAEWEQKLIPQAYNVQTTQITRAAWRYIPSTYLICESDQAAPPQYQEMFANNAKAHIERCSAGHSPQLSQVDMLVRKIEDAAHRAVSLAT
ncbi:MAG: hypothetical protein LQ342_007997 [Letrouitia transgressa]|nr:MAG: hypothetical protein LQ342_007997 [Letrouitia transgressa]